MKRWLIKNLLLLVKFLGETGNTQIDCMLVGYGVPYPKRTEKEFKLNK